MKTQICLIVFFISLLPFMYGQNQDVMKREYGYDDSGNRIVRKVLTIKAPKQQKSMDSQSETEDIDESEEFYTDKIGDVSLKIFPNPTTSVVTFQIESMQDAIDGVITLYNLSGAEIGSQRITSHRADIDLSSHPAGTYLATVLINGKTTHWKIIKQ